ncbi:MAG TPA: O-antigen ligase family protein [Clostridia bacterium]
MITLKKLFVVTIIIYGIAQSFYTFNEKLGTLSSAIGLLLFLELIGLVVTDSMKRHWKRMVPLDTFLILFVLIGFCMYSFISYKGFGFDNLFQIIKFSTVVLLMYYIIHMDLDLKSLRKTIIVFNLLIFGSILVCRVLSGRFAFQSYYGGDEYFGYFQNPHMIGMGLLGLTLFFFYQWTKEKKSHLLAFFLLDVALIYLSKIRTYFLAMVIGLSVFIIFTNTISIRKKILLGLVVAAGIVIILNFGLDVQMLSNRASDSDELQGISSGRTMFWQVIVNYFFQNANIIQILFGYGSGGAKRIMDTAMNWSIGSHNDWITFLVEDGVLGLMLYAGYYLNVFRKLFMKSDKAFVLTFFAAHVVSSVFNGTIYYTYSSLIFFLALGYVRASYVNVPDKKEEYKFNGMKVGLR